MKRALLILFTWLPFAAWSAIGDIATVPLNAQTAERFRTNPVDCGANTFAYAIAANGDLTCSSVPNAALNADVFSTAHTWGGSQVFNEQIIGSISGSSGSTTGNAATATALAADPAACPAGQYVSDIAANGALTCATPAGSGSGTVTTVSVVSANGFAGSVADPTTTPAITLTTSITGILKGNGTAISAASAGTDYVVPSGSITGNAATVTNGVYTTGSYADPSWITSIAGSKVSGNISGNAATATNATNIGVTNDTTTAATMYPVWVTATTGNLSAKVSSTKLSFNPSTGILVATGFSGTLTGNADTATALASNPSDCGANTFATTIAANGNLTCQAVQNAALNADVFSTSHNWGGDQSWDNGTGTGKYTFSGTDTPVFNWVNAHTLNPGGVISYGTAGLGGGIAGVVKARATPNNAIGVIGYAESNFNDANASAWAGYFEVVLLSGATTQNAFALEIDTMNYAAASAAVTPNCVSITGCSAPLTAGIWNATAPSIIASGVTNIGGTTAATALTTGLGYQILTVGTTTWSACGGSATPAVGDFFFATGACTGTGVAVRNYAAGAAYVVVGNIGGGVSGASSSFDRGLVIGARALSDLGTRDYRAISMGSWHKISWDDESAWIRGSGANTYNGATENTIQFGIGGASVVSLSSGGFVGLPVSGGFLTVVNNTASRPTSVAGAGVLAVSGNFSGGNGEVNLWNATDNAGGFVFRQKTGASSETTIMTVATGGVTVHSGNFIGNVTGNVTGSSGSTTGNAATVTNGVYTTGSYADPSWITSIAGSKVSGNISGAAATVTGAAQSSITSLGTLTALTINGWLAVQNNTTSYPTSVAGAGVLSVSGNFSGSGSEVNLWNVTDSAGGFVFRQKTGASSHNVLLNIQSAAVQLPQLASGGGTKYVCADVNGVLTVAASC